MIYNKKLMIGFLTVFLVLGTGIVYAANNTTNLDPINVPPSNVSEPSIAPTQNTTVPMQSTRVPIVWA